MPARLLREVELVETVGAGKRRRAQEGGVGKRKERGARTDPDR